MIKYLNFIFPLALLFFSVTGCKKSGIKPTSKLDTDALVHSIKLSAPTQFALTSVKNDTLYIVYYENVSLIIPTTGYVYSYALHVIEDFSKSSLANVHYTTIDQYGDVTHDFVDDNLNNITAKSVKDTTIAGVANKKITVQRPFTFMKPYTSTQAATAGQDSIDNVTTDNMNFHSYVYFGNTYPGASLGVNLFYIKGQ